MSMRAARRIVRYTAITAGITLSLTMTRANAGGMYSVIGLGSGTPSGISDAGQVLIGNSLVQNGVVTPLAIPYSPTGNNHTAISPGGTIAYSDGYMGPTHVIKDGQDYNAGAVRGGTVFGSDHSSPRAVNDAGAVVGESHTLARLEQAFISTPGPNGTYQALSLSNGTLGVGTATAINNPGTAVGWADAVNWRNQAFVGTMNNSPGYNSYGAAPNLIGTLGGQNSTATSINDKGQVVGWSNIATDWKPPSNPQGYFTPEPTHAFIYQNGKMTDLGTLPGYADSAATAINAMGRIVGHLSNTQDTIDTGSYSLVSSPLHAAMWAPNSTSPIDLNTLLPGGSGWILQDATGINASGQITGWGTLNGQEQAFLLTPGVGDAATVPEPGSLLVFSLITVVGVIARRKIRV
jgi:uncharacterized membrane protein